MTEYLQKILEDLADELKQSVVAPADTHLFTANNKCLKLNKAEAEQFHHVVVQLLFLSKRGHPDVLTTVTFLCTIVKQPDLDDL
mmetsp:Transcript_10408/g.10010  ORF Transcript_10408/g.10010 Transcript_10408/m.10010 type:complete len:84 (-) Transcript_10408:508-759(-)